MLCPCCSNIAFDSCCKPLLDGEQQAQSPQALMRSRYTAYCRQSIDYIHQTYAQAAKAQQSKADIGQWAKSVTFVWLDIIDAPAINLQTDDTQCHEGFVEFSAHYLQNATLHILHEKSRFIRENQLWRYLDGTLIPEASITIGRNDPCPCKSGKKFKKCHG